MAHFYGSIQGNRGAATRTGSKASGYDATAASWEGCVTTRLYHDEESGQDRCLVRLEPWHGRGTQRTLYDGPVGSYEPSGTAEG